MNILKLIKQKMCNHDYKLIGVDKLGCSKLYKCKHCGLYKTELIIEIKNCEYCGQDHYSEYSTTTNKINHNIWDDIEESN